ncbi:AAA family ATPase [Candidatus Saccharibacteria bacterium]|nr:AAA family ATPase [Candidatus Saccharibacteria bacterium]
MNKEDFRKYLQEVAVSKRTKSHFSSGAVTSYLSFLKKEKIFDYAPDKWENAKEFYEITEPEELKKIIDDLKSDSLFVNRDVSDNQYYRSNALEQYYNFLLYKKGIKEIPSENLPVEEDNTLTKQKVFFGAPGTGKSFTLKTQSSPFEDQKKIRKDKKDEIRNAIAEAITKSGKLTLLNSIGFKYSDELKNIQRKDLPSYCEYDKIDELYIGSNAKPISETIQITKDDQLSDIDFIKDLIQNKRGNNNSLKWANAIGFKFGDFLKDWTLDELRKTFELSEPQMWWIYRGAQASQIRSSEIETEIKYVERVTFHPNYSYAQFVGTYKPVQDNDDKKQIKYEYVPGPFMRMYCSAKKNPNNDFLLIIEEINRANVAAVFGDVFQLLDRKKGVSEYPVAASEDVRNYLADNGINDKELCIPNNMYIWATMNSADQGVFPMDTAFKRRWEFEYIGIDENEDGIKDYEIPLQKKEDGSHEWIKWNDLRHSINDKLTEMKINEDKLLGPYFITEEKLKLVEGKKEDNADEFVKSFKSKVLMYLFEDAVKMRPGDLFNENVIGRLRFSDICKKFDEIGQGIFNFKK